MTYEMIDFKFMKENVCKINKLFVRSFYDVREKCTRHEILFL